MDFQNKEIKSLADFFTDIEEGTNYGANKVSKLIIDEDLSADELFVKVAKLDAIKDKASQTMLDSKEDLIDWVNKYDKFELYFQQLISFIHAAETELSAKELLEYQAKFNKLIEIINEHEVDAETTIIKNKKLIMEFLSEPELAVYRRWFFMKYFHNEKHLLSKEEKFILGVAGGTQILDNILKSIFKEGIINHGLVTDSNGKPIEELTKENFNDPQIWKTWYKYQNSGIKSHFATLREIILGMYYRFGQEMQIKKFANRFEYQMHNLEIDTKLGVAILEQSAQFKDIFVKYREQLDKMIAAQMGVKEIEPWNRLRGLQFNNIKKSKDEAVEDAQNALAPLGQDYLDHFNKIVEENWINWDDESVRTNYSMTGRGNNYYPIRIKYEENTEGVMTLVHEAGHSVNAMMSKGLGIYSGIQSLIAEIPGFVNEALLFCYYMDKKYRDNANNEHFALIYWYMKRLYNNLCENPVYSLSATMWDKLIYEKDNSKLTWSDFVHAYRAILHKYGGVTKDEERWMKAHKDEDDRNIYDWREITNVFGAYNDGTSLVYFFGGLIGTSIGIDLYYGKNNMKEKYLNFLHRGNTSDPIRALKDLGFDVSKKTTYGRLVKWIDQMMNEFSSYQIGSGQQTQEKEKPRRKLVKRQH